MNKGKKFLIIPIDGEPSKMVTSTDYDEDNELIRYRDCVYDMQSGLYIVSLKEMNKGIGHWEQSGCSKVNCDDKEMMRYITNNVIFMNVINKLRTTDGYRNVDKINFIEKEMNLFNF